MNIQNWQQCIQEGDIIFSSIPHFLYKTIEKNTRSPTSHVGIIFKQNGQWVVAESKVPFSKVSPLEDFINRSDKGWISVKRLKTGLSQRQIERFFLRNLFLRAFLVIVVLSSIVRKRVGGEVISGLVDCFRGERSLCLLASSR